MRYFYLLILLSVSPFCLNAQSCLPGGITFLDQAQVDNFIQNNPGCRQIEGSVYFLQSDVTNVDSLLHITRIGGDLLINGNENLENLHGLASLQSVGGAMRIQNNNALRKLDGLENFKRAEGDFFYIGSNLVLNSLEGLSSLDTVAGIFQVWAHDSLTDLRGLENLRSVGDAFAVFNNGRLGSLTGIEGLTYVGSDLRINNNLTLTDISALDHPVQIEGALSINDNVLLSDCVVDAVCSYLAAPSTFAAINNNASGCADEAEVGTACLLISTGEAAPAQALRLFPNPTSAIVNIAADGFQIEKISLYDLTCRSVLSTKNTNSQIDLSGLPAGFYQVAITGKNGMIVRSLVKY